MGSRLRDKYYGQWLMLHVPFTDPQEFMTAAGVERAPATDKYLAACLACSHPIAVAWWNNPELQDESMLQEGHGSRYRQDVLVHIETQSYLVGQYMRGALVAPTIAGAPTQPRVRRKHVLPMLPKYQQQIRRGQKTVEGRLARGRALEMQSGELLQLGDVTMEVQEVIRYPNFRQMLQQEGYLLALPTAQSLDEAVAEYLSCLLCIVKPGLKLHSKHM